MKNKLLIFSILILCTSSCNYLEYDESDFLEKITAYSLCYSLNKTESKTRTALDK